MNDPRFSENLPHVKERILQICEELEEQIAQINSQNFFQQWANINSLEAQILILLELSEITNKKEKRVFTEEEVVKTAKKDCQTYFKEKCGMTLIDSTPHSLHFSIS
ncbi:MAG: hypothetical protein IJG24_06050 [Selenomonadaceae bacterium]|nr:hypothetical protein [Selenomonadaceae bacterium]